MIEKKPAIWPSGRCSRFVRNIVSCPHSCSTANHCTNDSASTICPNAQIATDRLSESQNPTDVIAAHSPTHTAPARSEGRKCASSLGLGGVVAASWATIVGAAICCCTAASGVRDEAPLL